MDEGRSLKPKDVTRILILGHLEYITRKTRAAHAVSQGIPRPYIQAVASWSTPHMLDQYTAAMEAEEGAIEAFKKFKRFRS